MSSDTRRALRDFVSLQRGTTYKGALVGLPGPVLLGLASIEPNGGFRYGGFKTYGGDCPEKISLKSGDLYVSLKDVTQSGDLLGSIARVPSDIASGRLTQDTVKLVFDGDPVSRDYIYWLLRTPAYREYCRGCATGTTTLGLSRDDFLDFPVPSPAPADELLIELLEGVEKRITLLRETNATLEAIAQALFKSWFVDFDPVRAKAEFRQPEGMDATTAALFPDSFEESELGLVPKGWTVRPIGELVEGIYDGPHATPAESADGPVFLGIKNLTGTSLDLSDIRHISESDWKQWTRRVEPRRGDIVFSYEATLGFFALIPPGVRCCLGRRLALVRPHAENGAGMFWFHQFISAPFQQLLDKHTIHGATVNRIALKAFPSYPVLNPPEPLKSAFVDSVAPLWAAIHENQVQAQTLTQLRDTLLPRLISGQLRLPEAEALMAEVAS
ncbi:restriction endonuclease subunit S [Pseudomonas sp. AOB-7]|uniref:restriction endonuclease subunit S n=1 Tax=Pseudomonas sp. AOB-7 TaxID=2482750 RepID=UPI001C4986F0|nr:restriction endonuclease subunit S [Pseudomonas sp. AOB-7]